MWTNLERQSKRYRRALWLTSALFLVGCSPQKHLTRTAQAESSTETVQRSDSTVQQQVATQLERLTVTEGETLTDIILFDTDKAVSESTGLPPVIAIVRKQETKTQRSRETMQDETLTEAQVTQELTERTAEHLQAAQTEERKPSAGTGFLRYAIGALLFALAGFGIWIIYKCNK